MPRPFSYSESIPNPILNPIPNPILKPIPKLQKRDKTQDILQFIDFGKKKNSFSFYSSVNELARYPVFSHVFGVSE